MARQVYTDAYTHQALLFSDEDDEGYVLNPLDHQESIDREMEAWKYIPTRQSLVCQGQGEQILAHIYKKLADHKLGETRLVDTIGAYYYAPCNKCMRIGDQYLRYHPGIHRREGQGNVCQRCYGATVAEAAAQTALRREAMLDWRECWGEVYDLAFFMRIPYWARFHWTQYAHFN